MTDLGSTVRLTASNVDGAGNPADPAGGPVLTVTLPDATPTTPAVVPDGTGSWHADLVTTQAGRYLARWVGTGAHAFAFVEAFTVDAADTGMLFNLREARKVILRRPDVAYDDDDDIREAVAAVTPVIEDLVGPILPRTCDEWYDGGSTAIVLDWSPVLSVTSLTESWGAGTTRTLTEQILDAGGTFDAYGYTIAKSTGLLERRVSGVASAFPAGRRNIHAVYVAGQPLAPNVRRAAKEQFRFMWTATREANRPGYVDSPDVEVDYTPSGYAVPNYVSQLCRPQQRIPGIA